MEVAILMGAEMDILMGTEMEFFITESSKSAWIPKEQMNKVGIINILLPKASGFPVVQAEP